MKKLLKYVVIIFVGFMVVGALTDQGGADSRSTATPARRAQTTQARAATAQRTATPVPVATPTPAPTAAPAPVIVPALTLVHQYDANKLAAQKRYSGRLVQTTARITNITSSFGQPYLVLEPAQDTSYTLTTIMCNVDDESKLLSLQKGQQVTVRGEMSEMFMTTIPLDHCTLVG